MDRSRSEVEKLLPRIAAQDRDAFEALFDVISARLLALCLSILGDRRLAEETLQDIFVQVWETADTQPVTGLSPMAWLMTLTRQAALARQRGSDAFVAPPMDAGAAADDKAADLSHYLARLDKVHAAALRRAYLEGITYAELADSADIPLSELRAWFRGGLLGLPTNEQTGAAS